MNFSWSVSSCFNFQAQNWCFFLPQMRSHQHEGCITKACSHGLNFRVFIGVLRWQSGMDAHRLFAITSPFEKIPTSSAWGIHVFVSRPGLQNTPIFKKKKSIQTVTCGFLHTHTPCIYHPAWIYLAMTFCLPPRQFFILCSVRGMSCTGTSLFPVDKVCK